MTDVSSNGHAHSVLAGGARFVNPDSPCLCYPKDKISWTLCLQIQNQYLFPILTETCLTKYRKQQREVEATLFTSQRDQAQEHYKGPFQQICHFMMVADAQIFMSLKQIDMNQISALSNTTISMICCILNDVLVNKVPHLSADQSTVFIKITISAWNIF